MNIGKKTSWQIAAVTAAALLTGAAQAHDRDDYRHGRGEYEHHYDRHYDRDRDGYGRRFEGRHDDDRRGYEREWHNRHWREGAQIWAPPLSPPWLLEHGFLGRR